MHLFIIRCVFYLPGGRYSFTPFVHHHHSCWWRCCLKSHVCEGGEKTFFKVQKRKKEGVLHNLCMCATYYFAILLVAWWISSRPFPSRSNRFVFSSATPSVRSDATMELSTKPTLAPNGRVPVPSLHPIILRVPRSLCGADDFLRRMWGSFLAIGYQMPKRTALPTASSFWIYALLIKLAIPC